MLNGPENGFITRMEITRLKKRRDELLNTACNRFERPRLLEEVRQINRRLRLLHERLNRETPQ